MKFFIFSLYYYFIYNFPDLNSIMWDFTVINGSVFFMHFICYYYHNIKNLFKMFNLLDRAHTDSSKKAGPQKVPANI